MSAGVSSVISFAKESAWGTAVTPTKSLAVHTGDGLQVNVNPQFPSALRGVLAKNNQCFFAGAADYEGELEVDLIPGYADYLFLSAMGSVTPATKGGETIVYTQTFAEAATKPSLTVEQSISEVCRRFAGVIATGFKINAKTGETIVVNFPVKAKSQATATAITPAYESGCPLNFAGVTVKIAGVTVAEVDNFEVEYKNNQMLINTLNGSANPSFNFAKHSEIAGKFELYLDSTSATEFTNYLSATNQSLQLIATGESIGVSSVRTLDLTIPKMVYKAVKIPLRDDYNLLQVEFEGVYDTATSKLLSLVSTNLLATLS